VRVASILRSFLTNLLGKATGSHLGKSASLANIVSESATPIICQVLSYHLVGTNWISHSIVFRLSRCTCFFQGDILQKPGHSHRRFSLIVSSVLLKCHHGDNFPFLLRQRLQRSKKRATVRLECNTHLECVLPNFSDSHMQEIYRSRCFGKLLKCGACTSFISGQEEPGLAGRF
jgi:hypothetical protein